MVQGTVRSNCTVSRRKAPDKGHCDWSGGGKSRGLPSPVRPGFRALPGSGGHMAADGGGWGRPRLGTPRAMAGSATPVRKGRAGRLMTSEGLEVSQRGCMQARNAGFSLVEAMVALLIFGIGTIVLMQLAPRSTQVAVQARSLSIANGLAQAKVEELRSLPKGHADLAAGTHVDPGNPLEGNYDRRWDVAENDPIDGMRRVEVRVRAENTTRGDSVAVLVTYF